MNKTTLILLAFCISATGCSSATKIQKLEEASLANQKNLRETDVRLSNLENSVTALNGQIAQLNNRVYEVRTSAGKKTSMTVVPMATSPKPVPVADKSPNTAPVSTENKSPKALSVTANTGEPALPMLRTEAKPDVPQATASKHLPKTGSIGKSSQGKPAVQGASGQLSAKNELPQATLALPPVSESSNSQQSAKASEPAQQSTLSLPPTELPNSDKKADSDKKILSEHKKAPVAEKGEDAAYKSALNVTRSGQYGNGIAKFQEFLQQYPQGKYAANAEYWIGEAYYAQGKIQDALGQFQKVNAGYATHHKNADALLKAGMCLNRLGNKEEAKEKFASVLDRFPKSEAASIIRSRGLNR